MRRGAHAGAFVLAAALTLGACGPSEACQRSCDALGVSDPEACRALCTGDCDELSETYGMSVERCEQFQAGEPR